ncbi:MAG: sulfatase [Pseudomonadales bacterium]|nr:sulfatase [Pseudomonadales bacterium]MCP5182880.1 sulfatase [Pseudomonadales bacterium]
MSNVIVVLLDSLNRHMLGAWGGREFDTPSLDRFAATATCFDNHFVGSLPCMPARHDILVGNLDFLWRPWGSIELWEEAITAPLRRKGVTTMLVTDHPHLFEVGGENYHTEFRGWEYLRGHESDPWKTRPDPSWAGTPALPAKRNREQYYNTSRTWFRDELDFPGPRTLDTAARWLDENAHAHESFLLFIDEFDPHEPFDTPAPWADRYDPHWDEDRIIWPPYSVRTVERGVLTEREARHIRANYGSKLSMIDHWFGRLLDSVERNGLTDNTTVIVCTDHGHYLGEKDIFGKPGVPHYETLGHTPLMIRHPGITPSRSSALTTNVDINATLYDLFDATPVYRSHGRSILPLLTGEQTHIREWALAGVWGRWVHVHDGRHKYARAPVAADNMPLAMWSNRWSTMPITPDHPFALPKPDRRARLDFMPGSDVPVIRQPFAPGDPLPFWALGQRPDQHFLFDLHNDPDETENRIGHAEERRLRDLLHAALSDIEAPAEQFTRLGLG